jgi:microcystin-dependent protein
MSTPFLGEIKMFAGNFAPRDYALCNGQLLSIATSSALFSILGTTYGGDGVSTFALPNLQGRFPMHWGTGAGLTARIVGEMSGAERVTLTTNQMPQHRHALNTLSSGGNTAAPTSGALIAASTARDNIYSTVGSVDTAMAVGSIGPEGGGLPVSIMPPFTAVTFIIALTGIFPSRN